MTATQEQQELRKAMDNPRPLSELLALCSHPDSRVTIVKHSKEGDEVFLRFNIRDRIDDTFAEGSRRFPLDQEFEDFQDFERALWSSDDLAEMEPDPFPHVSLWWVFPPLLVSSTLAFTLAALGGEGIGSGLPFVVAIGITGQVLGTRHALLLTALALVVQNPLTTYPLLTLSAPEPVEFVRAAAWIIVALVAPWLTANLYRIQMWVWNADRARISAMKNTNKINV